jgi:hypothetical protein
MGFLKVIARFYEYNMIENKAFKASLALSFDLFYKGKTLLSVERGRIRQK